MDKVLRGVGAAGLIYLACSTIYTSIKLSNLPPTSIAGILLWCLLAFGVLHKGRKFHLGVAIFMLVGVAVNIILYKRVVDHPEIAIAINSSNLLLSFLIAILPFVVVFIATVMLYFHRPTQSKSGMKET